MTSRSAQRRQRQAAADPKPKLGVNGELVPWHGFSRIQVRLPRGETAWRSAGGLLVVSSREAAELPGSGAPPLVGPQWLVSVSRNGHRMVDARRPADRRCSPADVAHVVACFAMPAFDEDNHHPGIARHLWCPIDPQYQQACECHIREVTVVDGDYAWTTEETECRGCEYETLFGSPCPRHPKLPA